MKSIMFYHMMNRNENEPKMRSDVQKRHWRIWKACRLDLSA